MEGDRMVMRAALMAMLFAAMCAPSAARIVTLTHKMVSPYVPSGHVASTLEAPPNTHPEHESWYVPPRGARGVIHLFDRNQLTTFTAQNREGDDYVFVEYVFPRLTKVKKYRIVVDKGGDPEEYPAAWVLYGTKETDNDILGEPWFPYSRKGLVELHRSQPGQTFPMSIQKLTRRGKFRKYRLEFTADGKPDDGKVRVTMAEIKLLGKIKEFDDPEFPGGVYPCEKPLSKLTRQDPFEKGTPFSTKSYSGRYKGEEAFRDVGYSFISAVYPTPPVIIGYEFNKPKIVHMYRTIYTNGGLFERALKDFEFQGSFCNGGCNEFGEDGWVTLDTVTGNKWNGSPSAWDGGDQFVVPDPKPYKAYRLRITKDNYGGDVTAVNVGYFVLFGCKA